MYARSSIRSIRPGTPRYRIERGRLEIVVAPPYIPPALDALYEAVRDDPRLPARFVMLVDTRALNLDLSLGDVVRRVGSIVDVFGGRLRALAHVRAADERTPETHLKVAADERRLRHSVFYNVEIARLWLDAIARDVGGGNMG